MKHWITFIAACALVVSIGRVSHANEGEVQARIWSPSVPLATESLPSVQSEPSIGMSGNHTFVVWTDSRNTSPDIYASTMLNGAKPADSRVTNIGPWFDTQHAFGASVTVEPSGRAFAAYSDGEEIFVARYDVTSGQWLSRTQVTSGLNDWQQVAKYPAIASDGSGNLVIVWEDFRNADQANNSVNNKGSDIYAGTCNGNTMTCAASNVKVNDDSARADQRRPRLSRNGNNVVVIWEDHRERGPEFPRVYAAFSGNGGQSFGANLRVNKSLSGNADPNSRDAATMPSVAYVPDGSAWAAWENHIGSATAPPDIYASQWNGAAWSTPLRVDGAPARVRSLLPSVGASSAGLFVAWQDYRNGANNADIYTARWSGSGWSEIGAAVTGGMQTQPVLSGQGNSVRLAWQDTRTGNPDVFMSAWNGSGWSGATQVNETASRAPYQTSPDLATDGGSAYALMLDSREGYKQLWLQPLVAQTGLPSWGARIALPTQARDGGDISAEGAGIAFSNNGLQAVWSEYVYPFGRQIHISAYANGEWTDPVRITGSDTDDRERFAPAIAARGNNLAVVWSYRDTNNLANLYASFNTGAGWSAPVAVMQQAVDAWIVPSSIAIDGNNTVFVAYSLDGANGRSRIFVARRSIGGASWSYAQVSPDVNSDWCQQEWPQVRVGSDNRVHVVWSGCALRNPPNAWPHDSFVFYAASTNSGASFSAPLKVAQTIASTDEDNSNDTSSRPALAIGGNNEAMVLFPSRITGKWAFHATLMTNGAPSQPVMVSDSNNNWAKPQQYFGDWSGGDSRGALIYDAAQLRYVAVYPDRSNGRSPRIYSASYGDLTLRRTFVPVVLR